MAASDDEIAQLKEQNAALRARVAELEAMQHGQESALAERERVFRAFAENSPDLITRVDRELRYQYINRVVSRVSNLTPEAYVGRHFGEVNATRPEVVKLWEGILTEAFATGTTRDVETDFSTPNGTLYHRTRIIPERDGDGNITSIVTVTRDVTDLKQAQDHVFERDQTFQVLVENAGDIISRYDRDLRVTYINPAMTELIGRPVSEFIGKRQEEIITSSDVARSWNDNIQAVFDSGQERSIEFSFPSPYSPTRHFLCRLMPERNRTGEVAAVIGISREITELKTTLDNLSRTEHLFRVLVENLPDAIVRFDRDKRYLYVNPASTKASGIPLEAHVGRTNAEVGFVGEQVDVWERTIDGVVATGETVTIETEYLAANGEMHYYHVRYIPEFGDDGSVESVLCVTSDVTERRMMEQELQKANKLESVGVLAGGIAHDFNNYLAAILGNLALVRRSVPSESSAYRNLAEAESATLRARGLTQQLLTFAKGGAPVKHAVSPTKLINESAKFALMGTNARSDVRVDDTLWNVEIDEGQIGQVINNLVLNAQQAMPGGGVVAVRAINDLVGERDMTRHGIVLEPGTYVCLSVADRGVGIPRDYLPRIFDPYFTTKQTGSGLGLAITYAIVRNHNGQIAVESEPGVGTTFWVYLPAVARPENVAPPSVAPAPLVRRPLRVLVMDDQEMIRGIMSDVLTDEGYTVDESSDGAEAIHKYQQAQANGQPYDVVIMDLTIPGGMGGQEAVRRLHEIDPNVRAVVSSGYANDPITSNYAAHGFKAVIPKPFDIDELAAIVARVAYDAAGIAAAH